MDFTVLIAEDEPHLREILCDYFTSRGATPISAPDGLSALELARSQVFDICLLDIMMPGLDGLSVCRALRKNSDVPIIFLTALSDEEDKLLGYELGADDYVTKPFSMNVLYAKAAALVKRSRGNLRSGDRLNAGALELVLGARKAFAGQQEIELSPKEYALLECLMRNKNVVLSRDQLLIKCWGYDYDGDIRAVDTHIKRLREKLGSHAGMIKTVVKAGYKLEVTV